ncbi:TetR/AcrR family transcriptional regulator [Streptomyces sp. NPDC090106]|uniref:TetR/AcrR family transcriptional regulator n=1 Tax=Streptomyces sp. NPDC090106 TaxID=3365946 RepID=UPI00380F86D0
MPADERTAALPSLRERRRAVAVREIVDTAERQIDEHGPHALSLRAVARELGMSVQGLYHYFPNRDALVTVLITKAYEELTEAVRAAAERAPLEPELPSFVVAAEGYRGWAITHGERFQLLYGAPLRHYAAPVAGPTTRALLEMSAVFERELFGGFTEEQLAGADAGGLSPELRAHLEGQATDRQDSLPPAATALLLHAWGRMHGLVVLEVFGHFSFTGTHQAEIFRQAMRTLLEDLHHRIPPAGDGPARGASMN